MARELKSIDVTDAPDLLRLAEEVAQTGAPCVLRRGDQDVAVLSPMSRSTGRPGRDEPTSDDDPLQRIIGIADAADFPDVPKDVSSNKHAYLAERRPGEA